MKTFYSDTSSPKDLHNIMLSAITPRPIALVSTQDDLGNKNIAPFSYFNAISSTPPILVFSVNRKPDGSKKDTLLNIEATEECVVNMVNYKISQQMALAGIQFDNNIDEFNKTGFTSVKSTTITPYGVQEAPVRFECKLNRIISFGEHPGASRLIICDVKCIHIDEATINEKNKIDPVKLDLIGRLGRAFYLKTSKENIFAIPQRRAGKPIGFDNLPKTLLSSNILTGNQIARIATLEKLPTREEVKKLYESLKNFNFGIDEFHQYAGFELNHDQVYMAATFALIPEYL